MVPYMARLKTSRRARLPDSAFAYVDSRGGRRLPVHDRAHVKNALARFNQVAFENDAARERARKRLLNAAKRRSEEHSLNSSHRCISYAVFCLKKKKHTSNVRSNEKQKMQNETQSTTNERT